MAAHPKRIEIAPEDRPVLERWASSRVVERRQVDRARIVLMAAEGRPARDLIRFLERLEEEIPTGKQVIAILDNPGSPRYSGGSHPQRPSAPRTEPLARWC